MVNVRHVACTCSQVGSEVQPLVHVTVDGFADVLRCFFVGKDVLGMDLCLFLCALLGSSGFVRALRPFCIGGVCAACSAKSCIFKAFCVSISMVSNLRVFAVNVCAQSPILSPFIASMVLAFIFKGRL